jgi:hypothetical protein
MRRLAMIGRSRRLSRVRVIGVLGVSGMSRMRVFVLIRHLNGSSTDDTSSGRFLGRGVDPIRSILHG